MTGDPAQKRDPAVHGLTRAIVGAEDPQIIRMVALVDAMMQRGSADLLIEPLRQRLARLRPPRPLRFERLLFHPLDLLIVPAARWRPGQHAIPRSALKPMADHVRLRMGAAATGVEAETAGRTTADRALISRLGQSLWPAAAGVLADSAIPPAWEATGLGDGSYRSLADAVMTLLGEAATVDTLATDAATGLLRPGPEPIAAMLRRVVRANAAALPMVIAVLLDQLPTAAELLPAAHSSAEADAVHAAMGPAADLLLRQLDQEDGTAARIAAGSLTDAGAAVRRIATLLSYLETTSADPRRRERVRAARKRLEAQCKARFASGLQDELLAPLERLGIAPAAADIPALESAARGLRVLEIEARVIGSGSTYDLLLGQAAETIKAVAMRDRLLRADQIRLVEILVGSNAALAMLGQPS